MGLENRDYVREDSYGARSFRGAAPRSMVTILIGVTVAVFVLQLLTTRPGQGSAVTRALQLTAEDVLFRGQIWRLLTSAFLHAPNDLLHLVFNMLTLAFIGPMVRDRLRDREFLWFYLVSAVFAGLCSMTFYRLINVPAAIIGASGATMAVFCLAACFAPRVRVLLMGVIPVEMRWLLWFYVGLDSLPILTGRAGDSRVANSAHLGGLLFGWLYFRWNMRITSWWDAFAGRMRARRIARGPLKVYRPSEQPESAIGEQVDAILEKISREGEASLTAKERNLLTQASRQLRKDRDRP
jgi:membrane associated rhomboid family serine protease